MYNFSICKTFFNNFSNISRSKHAEFIPITVYSIKIYWTNLTFAKNNFLMYIRTENKNKNDLTILTFTYISSFGRFIILWCFFCLFVFTFIYSVYFTGKFTQIREYTIIKLDLSSTLPLKIHYPHLSLCLCIYQCMRSP